MLLTAVNIRILQASADAFAGEGDFDGIYDAVRDHFDFILAYVIRFGNFRFFQVFGNAQHIVPVVKNKVEGNKQRACVFASQNFGVID